MCKIMRKFYEADDGTGGGGAVVAEEPVMTQEAMLEEAVNEINVDKGYTEPEDVPEVKVEADGEDVQEPDQEVAPVEAVVENEAPTEDEIIVKGETSEEIEKNVNALSKKLGYDEQDTKILLQANFKKRFEDNRKAFNLKAQELADLKKKGEAIPQNKDSEEVSQGGGADTSSSSFVGLSDDAKETLEDTPELKELFDAQESKMKTMLDDAFAKRQAVADSVHAEKTIDEKNASWRAGVTEVFPDGLDLYQSPEFMDWERQRANSLESKLGHYDNHDPQKTIEMIQMFEKDRGSVALSKKKEAEDRKKMRSGTAHHVGGSSTPQSRKTVGAPEGDMEAMTREAIAEINKQKGYRGRGRFKT